MNDEITAGRVKLSNEILLHALDKCLNESRLNH